MMHRLQCEEGPANQLLLSLRWEEASQTILPPFACVAVSGITVIAWKKRVEYHI